MRGRERIPVPEITYKSNFGEAGKHFEEIKCRGGRERCGGHDVEIYIFSEMFAGRGDGGYGWS